MAFSLYQLYFRPYQLAGGNTRVTVAKIKSPTKTVKFKENESFSWKDARQGLGLSIGDRLYTHNNSMADVDFIDGPQINMAPNTLLQIKLEDKNYGLQVESGSIATSFNDKTEHITLILGARKFVIKGKTKGTKLKVTRKDNSATVTVLSGVAKIDEITNKTPQGSKEIEDSAIELSSEKMLEEALVTKLIIKPDKELSGIVKGFRNQKFEISWEYLNKDSNIPRESTVEVTTPEGKVLKTPLNSGQTTFDIKPFENGIYHYRITTEGESSPLSTFTFSPYAFPTLNIERERDFFFTDESVLLTVEERPYPQVLHVFSQKNQEVVKEIAIGPRGINESEKLLNLDFPLKDFPPGSYFLQLKPDSKLIPNLESASIELYKAEEALTISSPLKLLAPTLDPQQPEVITSYQEEAQVSLNWQEEETSIKTGAPINWEIQWEEGNNSFTKVTQTNQVTFPTSHKGKLRYRVRKVVATNKSPWSDWKEMTIIKENVKVFPKTGSEIFLDKPNQLVDFKWQPPSGKSLAKNEKYVFEVSKNQSFKKQTLKRETKDSAIKIPLGEKGTYFWRVKIVDKTGKSRYGSPVEIKVSPAPPPSPLKLQEKLEIKLKPKSSQRSSPRNILNKSFASFLLRNLIQRINAENSEKLIAPINWPKEDLAKSYLLRVFKEGQEEPFLEVEVDTNSYEWINPTPGTYSFEVVIRDYWERLGKPSNRSELVIVAPELKKTQKKSGPLWSLISPVHKKSISLKRDSHQSISFIFEGPKNEEATLEFSTSLDFTRPFYKVDLKKDRSFNAPLETLSQNFPSQKSISFYWRVKSTNGKSYRRNIILERNYSMVPTSLASVKPTSHKSRFFFQEITQTSVEQNSTSFNAEASGLFVHSIGVNLPVTNNLSSTFKVGTGKAFDSLRYNQLRANLWYAFQDLSWTKSWLLSLGIEANGQTSFTEENSSTLSEGLDLNFMASLKIGREFSLFKRTGGLNLEASFGQAILYRLTLKREMGVVLHSPLHLGLFYENLEYSVDNGDLSRSSLGLLWSLSL